MPKKRTAVDRDLGLVITILREIRGWNQQELAHAAGLRESSISDYEGGKVTPELKNLRRVLAALGYSLTAVDETLQFITLMRGQSADAGLVEGRAGDRVSVRVDALAAQAGRTMEAFARSFFRLLAEQSSLKSHEPPEEGPELAAELWDQLAGLSPRRQEALIRSDRAFWSWRLVELLSTKSVAMSAENAVKAVHLAELACLVSDQLPTGAAWASKVRAFALAHLGNARRVVGDLLRAEEALEAAEREWQAGAGSPDFLPAARIPDLFASLRRSQRRLPEALSLLERALSLDPLGQATGRLLLKKAKTLEELGEMESAIAVLREALPSVEASRDPRLHFCLRHNLVDYLSKSERFGEARAELPEVERLERKSAGEIDRIRVLWTKGRIAAGFGEFDTAVDALSRVRGAFVSHEMYYDAALVSLELALLYLDAGRTEEVKALARHMVPIFQSRKVHREALAALAVFRGAAEREEASSELVRGVVTYLERARHNPGLRYEA
jgi:tetratricopeptide (TPR) repeat protein/DNA-binding XRE family transcriptional regulator